MSQFQKEIQEMEKAIQETHQELKSLQNTFLSSGQKNVKQLSECEARLNALIFGRELANKKLIAFEEEEKRLAQIEAFERKKFKVEEIEKKMRASQKLIDELIKNSKKISEVLTNINRIREVITYDIRSISDRETALRFESRLIKMYDLESYLAGVFISSGLPTSIIKKPTPFHMKESEFLFQIVEQRDSTAIAEAKERIFNETKDPNKKIDEF